MKTEAKKIIDKFGALALDHVEGIIKELQQLHKPEYATFILRYDLEEPETMDGYEKLDYWREILKEIEN